MKLNKILPFGLMVLTVSVPAMADTVTTIIQTTAVPCSVPATGMIPDYTAKIASLRTGAEQNIIAYTAMTPAARTSVDGQSMMQQAKVMFAEAQSCQKIADDMALQVPAEAAMP